MQDVRELNPEQDRSTVTRLSWLVIAAGGAALYPLSSLSYPIFHTLVELFSIAIGWGAFLLLWTARRYLAEKSFLVLGLALFAAGCVDLLHTMAYKGVGAFHGFDAADLATQFWIAARSIETLGWLLFAALQRRRVRLRPLMTLFLALVPATVLSILVWRIFPACFVPGEGLTPFKIVMEIVFVVMMAAALLLLRWRSDDLDPVKSRLMQIALVLSIAAELAFMLYRDVYGVSNLVGHYLRIVARYLVYLALIRMSIIKPHALFFRELQSEAAALSRLESRWRSFTGSSPDHVFELDADLNVRFVNRLPGDWREVDVLHKPLMDNLDGAERERITEVLRRVQATGRQESFDWTHARPGAHGRRFACTAVPLVAEGITAGSVMLVARDVTERALQEELLQARLRISEAARDHDLTGLLRFVLDEAEALTGSRIGFFHFVEGDQETLRLQAWSSRTLNEACTAEGQDRHYPLSAAGVWADCVRERRPVIHNDYASLPGRRAMPPGHAEVVREVVVPVFRDDRVVAVLGVGNRPTEYDEDDVKRLTELADMAWDIVVSQRAVLELRRSERRLSRTLENLPGMVFRCANDEHWTMSFVSNGCRDLTGFEVDDLVGNRVVSYASLIHPDDRGLVDDAVQAGVAGRTSYQITYRIVPRGGGPRWVWERGAGVFDGDRLEAIEGFIYDINDLVEAQHERQEMERKVLEAQKLESLGVMAGGIAHDFNNLLQSILGFAELAGERLDPAHPARQSIDLVVTSATRAAGLTRQMLDFSGQGHFAVSNVDLSVLVRDMAALLESSVPRNIAFRRDLAEGMPYIAADASQLQQVVMNLVTNAAEAVGEAEGQVDVSTGQVHCDARFLAAEAGPRDPSTPPPTPGDYVYLEVRDTGCGMDEATRSRIFEPFFTTKFTGRGLGLAAVQGIVRGHRGLLTIASRPGEGTTMRVLLPVARSAAGPKVAPGGSGDPAAGGARSTVLVVEDEPEVLSALALSLEAHGYEVATAGDGVAALEVFEARADEIACVVLDVMMPRMGGRECLARLREQRPDLPVILISGFAELEVRQKFTGHRVDAVLPKPFQRSDLLRALEQVLG